MFVKGEVRRFNTGFMRSGNGCCSMHCPNYNSVAVPVVVEREWDGEKWVDLMERPATVSPSVSAHSHSFT
jgi:hypothetical protein